MTGRFSPSESDLESASMVDMGGDGAIGDTIGTITTRFIITKGITREAGPSITEARTPVATARAAAITTVAVARAAGISTVAVAPGEASHLTATEMLLEDTASPEVRTARVQELSAVTAVAAMNGAIRHAEARASAAEAEALTAAEALLTVVAGVPINRVLGFPDDLHYGAGRIARWGERS